MKTAVYALIVRGDKLDASIPAIYGVYASEQRANEVGRELFGSYYEIQNTTLYYNDYTINNNATVIY